MTKKQSNVIVGTVKKSMAAIASRWLRRKASQRLARSGSLGALFHPTGDGSLGNLKPEYEEFAMYPRRSPAGVLNDHPKDQFPNLLRCRSSSDLPTDSGDQPTVHSKTSPVPTDYGFWCDDEGVLPIRPDPPGDYPEELIEGIDARARMSKQSPRTRNMVRIHNRTVVR